MLKKIIPLLFLFILIGTGSSFSQQITISVPDTAVDAGSVIEVPVNVSELTAADGVVAGEWEFTTSSGMISITGADAAGSILEGSNLTFNATTGRLAFAGTDTLTGRGTLFKINVQVAGDASKFEEATIDFRNPLLNEGNPAVQTESGTIRVRGISIEPQRPTGAVVVGNTFQFDLTGDTEGPVTWSTSDGAIASIDGNGLLTANENGTVRVYAEDSSGLADSTDLFRIEPESLLNLTLSASSAAITQTLVDTISVAVSDVTGLDILSGQFELAYPPGKITVLSVITEQTMLDGAALQVNDENDRLKMAFSYPDTLKGSGDLLKLRVQIPRNASGTATITPQNILFNESIEAVAEAGTITIDEAPTPDIEPGSTELTIGETVSFSVISGGTPPYTWKSSNPEVASVDPSTGAMEAISRGIAEITATDADNFSSEASAVRVNDITLSISDYTMSDGGTVSVPLETMDVTGLDIFSYEIEIEYDPGVVAFNELQTTGTLSDGMTATASSEGGVVTIAAASATPLSGEGSLIDVVFDRSENPGSSQKTDLIFKRVQFNEPGPDAPTATTVSGSISVEGVSWTGNGDGTSWSDPDNWSSAAIPGSENDVLIGLDPGSNYTITTTEPVTVNSILLASSNASLDIGNTFTVQTSYIQTGASLGGSGTLEVAGLLGWESGTLSGSGEIRPLGGIELSGTGPKVLDGRTLSISDGTEATFGGTNFSGQNGATIAVGTNGVLNLQPEAGSGYFSAGTGGATLSNSGDIQITSGASTSVAMEWDLENSGNITMSAENTTFSINGLVTDNQGTYHAQNGTLKFATDGIYQFRDGSEITAAPTGTIHFGTLSSDSEITMNGLLNVNGTTIVRSGSDGVATLIIPETAELTSLGGAGVIIGGSQGELLLQTGSPITIGSLELNAGSYLSVDEELTVTGNYVQNHQTATFTSDHSVNVDGNFTWSGGLMAGSDTTFANAGISISGNDEASTKTLDTRSLVLTGGSADYRGDRFQAGNGSSFIVEEGASIDLRPLNETTTLSVLEGSSFQPVLINRGTISSSRNNNVFTVDWAFENEGVIDLGNNNLVVDATTGLENSGTFRGSGNMIGNFKNLDGGLIQPGSDSEIGQIQISGGFSQDTLSAVKVKIAGSTAGSTYDQIRAANVTLAGTLSVDLLNNFTPADAESFQSIVWPGGTRTGNFTQFEGFETGDLSLTIRLLDEALEIYDGTFRPDPGSASISVSVSTPPFQRIGRSVPIDATIRNAGETSMQRIRVENFTYGVPASTVPECPTNDAYENLKCRMERFGVTPPPPEEGMEEEYPFLLQQRFPATIGGGSGGGGGDTEATEFTSVTSGGGSFGISGNEACENEPVNPVVKAGSPVTDADLNQCAYQIAKLALDVTLGFVPGADCFGLAVGISSSIGEGIHKGQFDLLGYMSANMVGAVNCAGDAVPATKAIKIMKKLNDLASKGQGLKDVSDACSRASGSAGSVSASGSSSTTCIGSYDPNDKVGPAGVLDQRYIASGDSLPYVVFFENLDEATAAAQKVIISDTLDTDHFDFDSFSFGMIAWSDTSVSMTPNVSSATKDVDLRPEMNLILRIEADLDTDTGLLEWVFTSLDPETMEPTPDPLAGFLPPNQNSPEGEGLVSYFVSTKEGTPSNTTFGNSARIIFDENDPIDTPVWSNTLDTEPPVSFVEPLDSVQTELEFTVNWSGEDDASGIELYNVYVSADGGPFEIWKEETTETTDVFTGADDTEYKFISQATDWTGNMEELRGEADTKTTVQLSTSNEPAAGIPDQYSLEQNYPNPFNPATTIRFGIPENGSVLLDVYNMAGQKVATLVNEQMSAGWHTVRFDASGLASGMYVYRIQSGDFVNTRKLILVK